MGEEGYVWGFLSTRTRHSSPLQLGPPTEVRTPPRFAGDGSRRHKQGHLASLPATDRPAVYATDRPAIRQASRLRNRQVSL